MGLEIQSLIIFSAFAATNPAISIRRMNLAIMSRNSIHQATLSPSGEGSPVQPTGSWTEPRGLVVDGSGFVYVADTYNRVDPLDSNGNFIKDWGCYRRLFNRRIRKCTRGVYLGHDGCVYVVDSGNNRIEQFSMAGLFLSTWETFRQWKQPVQRAVRHLPGFFR